MVTTRSCAFEMLSPGGLAVLAKSHRDLGRAERSL